MFYYQGAKGKVIILQGESCHNNPVEEDEVQVQIVSIGKEITHSKYNYTIEQDFKQLN